MNSPVPTPRSTGGEPKRPVPTPRRTKMPETVNKPIDDNSFSKKARQKLEGLGEGTRQSLRKLSRRFSSASQRDSVGETTEEANNLEIPSLDIFNSITFASPISKNADKNIYNNLNIDSDNSSLDSVNLPPPSHPPPPLPDVSLYDAPSSVASQSTSTSTDSSSTSNKKHDYETVFPSPIRKEFVIADDDSLSTSGSWRFYDTVTKTGSDNEINEPEPEDVILRPSTSKADDNISIPSTLKSNSLYENYVPPSQRPTKSVIVQFDPLVNNNSETYTGNSTQSSDLKTLERFLLDDIYGTIGDTLGSLSLSLESDSDEFINPPTPPTRFDSLPEEELGEPTPATTANPSRSTWFDDSSISNHSSSSSSNNNNHNVEPKKKLFQKFFDKAPEIFKNIKGQKDNVVERPEIAPLKLTSKVGRLYKIQNNSVEGLFGELSVRWCVLEQTNLVCYADAERSSIKENFKDSSILSLQLMQDSKFKPKNNENLSCFEINVVGKSRGGHIYGTKHLSETRSWLQAIAENMTSKFSKMLTSSYSRFGWAYIKEALNSSWVGAWIILKDRELHYVTNKHSTPKCIDLRKARCIVLQAYQEQDKNPSTNDKGPNLIIDCPHICFYARMWTSRETKVWCHIIKTAAHNNGPTLSEQQLTKNNIPVIVETCLNFVYLYGSMTEGIYRKTGTNSAVSDLLAQFRTNAFSVHLTTEKYSEHDVATALKRFFRDLPEPLIKQDKRQYLYQVSKINNESEKIRMFKAVLEEHPEIQYKTIRKLLGHLNFISTQESKNLMNVANLASIWGPTLMQSEGEDRSFQTDAEVIGQLMSLYHDIFPEDRTEMEKEKSILEVLKKYHNTPQLIFEKKNAGDFRVWVYLLKKDGQSVNVSVGPKKTAHELAKELCSKLNSTPDQVIFKEVILEGKLERPVHHTEKILDVVLKWGDWNEQDRKDNYLVLTHLSEFEPYMKDKEITHLNDNLRFTDSKTRYWKSLNFSFSAATLKCYKSPKMDELHSWRIEDIVWYLGNERKGSSAKWCITFLLKSEIPKRTRSSPFFGNVLAFNDAKARMHWANTMLKSQYPTNLKPPVQFVNIE